MTTPSTVSSTRRWGIVVGAALVVLGLDQLTKAWAVDRLKGQFPIDVLWTLRFNYAENTGMAFSKGSGAGRWISLVVLAIVVALVLLARSVRSTAALVLIGVVILQDRRPVPLIPRWLGFVNLWVGFLFLPAQAAVFVHDQCRVAIEFDADSVASTR